MGDGLRTLEDRTFLWLTVAISVAFAWILWPFYGAVLWATILAIVFAPVYRRLAKSMGQRRNLAALATVAIIVAIVILPATLITASLVEEASGLYERFRSGELNLARNFQQGLDALPPWVTNLLDRFGLTDLATVEQRLADIFMRGSQFLATQAINIGQTCPCSKFNLARLRTGTSSVVPRDLTRLDVRSDDAGRQPPGRQLCCCLYRVAAQGEAVDSPC